MNYEAKIQNGEISNASEKIIEKKYNYNSDKNNGPKSRK